tara:strand:+ start:6018 stop:6188 length:171 start_codon:yes stop_codon:yes gene_type:complete
MRPKCDLDTAYVKLCDAIESMKDALAYAQMALAEMPPPAKTQECYEEPTYIGGEHG